MTAAEALALLGAARPAEAGPTWADLGAGAGTFTRALAELLGPAGTVYAVDRDPRSVASLHALAARQARATARVVAAEGDFTRPLDLPAPCDGLLLANALHFVPDAATALARLTSAHLRPGGRVIVIEYDRRPTSRWVPYPLDADRLPDLAARAGLATPAVVATRPSAFGGTIYVAVADMSP